MEQLKQAGTRTFPHAMLREIYEQPQALQAAMDHYLPAGKLNPEAFGNAAEALRGKQRLVIAASGSSRNAGLAAELMLEDLAGLTVDVEYASEYCYRSTHTLQDPGVIVISQSGETADTLAALNEGKSRGLTTVAITNNPGSTMAREADASFRHMPVLRRQFPQPRAYHPIGRALCAGVVPRPPARPDDGARRDARSAQFRSFPRVLEAAIEVGRARIGTSSQVLRGTNFPVPRARGSLCDCQGRRLKLKESAYLQAEGYPAGELKHGPNALVSASAPLVVMATRDEPIPIRCCDMRRRCNS